MISPSLFSNLEIQEDKKPFESLDLEDSHLLYCPNYFSEKDSQAYFAKLIDNIIWKQNKITMFNKEYDVPRKEAWYGDIGAEYTYSKIKFMPEPWIPILSKLRLVAQRISGSMFNSVLVNLYRDGQDYVSWHSDDEPELGSNPTILSMSFGETRWFNLKHKSKKLQYKIALLDGSVLIMSGKTQVNYLHQIAKTRKECNSRINLTFRYIKD